ncbi:MULTISPECIES: 50S ribosomal protein L24 [unclassified Aeromicrobium]|jgi:large subunit ribosomal protein L24|uniref:50S ribosomal protein L24 n=1 Tax=unclassified Aeromicrobium TaxID=2633570 RepID=UPI002097D88E|nr:MULTISPECIES: 50S ribosomal protein L24 [unclassified Aeromicrobium]MCO7238300.1 50S ribosomal protein L24 [Aeromicrobium sp. CnD17-E]MDR6117071.1 large subunit ribosomal protein L24 [Aeromicrobium sp. SORGH_AS_0981]
MTSNKRTLSIRKGDQVKVIAGADKGVEGKVIEVLAERERVIVEGVNRIKRHTRAGADGTQGGIITREAPIHVSNVMLVVDVDGDKTTTRVSHRRDDVTKNRPDGSSYEAQRSVRVSSKTGKEI